MVGQDRARAPTLRDAVKTFLGESFPSAFFSVKDVLGRLYDVDIARRFEHTIMAGPFKGMRYIDHANCGALGPRILGTYEYELHGVIDRIVRGQYDRIVDIGSAEGYYAIGLARAMPAAAVFAFDTDTRARADLVEMAALNGVQDRLHIGGECTADDLQRLSVGRVLVVCDIEGGEIDLLDPVQTPALGCCDLIVEFHDSLGSTRIRDGLCARFAASHDVEVFRFHERTLDDVRHVRGFLSTRSKLAAVDELRVPREMPPGMPLGLEWGVFRARRQPLPPPT